MTMCIRDQIDFTDPALLALGSPLGNRSRKSQIVLLENRFPKPPFPQKPIFPNPFFLKSISRIAIIEILEIVSN